MERTDTTQEQEQRVRPAVRIEAGNVTGWLDADQPADAFSAAAAALVGGPGWHIAEYRGFGELALRPDERPEHVSAVAVGIAEHGPVYGSLVGRVGIEVMLAEPEGYERALVGRWPDRRSFLRELAADSGFAEHLETLPGRIRPYVRIDYRRLAADVRRELFVIRDDEAVVVFDPRVWTHFSVAQTQRLAHNESQ